MNLIIKAIEKDEFDLFLMGYGNYRCQGSSDLWEPNDFVLCWNTEIIPYANTGKNDILEKKMMDALYKLSNREKDINLEVYTIILTINWYYFYKSQNRIDFKMDLVDFSILLKDKLKRQKDKLQKDYRWGGEKWNSNDGLWEPLINTLTFIINKYDGINCIP
jgi:hypothetical protein